MPWTNKYIFSFFKEHGAWCTDVDNNSDPERNWEIPQDVNVSANWSTLDYLTNCNKKDLQKTIRKNCTYHCSANIISQLFCQKNIIILKTGVKENILKMYTVQFTFSFFSIYKCFLCLLSNLAFVRTSFFTCPQCLFYLIASLSAARVPVMHRASSSSE